MEVILLVGFLTLVCGTVSEGGAQDQDMMESAITKGHSTSSAEDYQTSKSERLTSTEDFNVKKESNALEKDGKLSIKQKKLVEVVDKKMKSKSITEDEERSTFQEDLDTQYSIKGDTENLNSNKLKARHHATKNETKITETEKEGKNIEKKKSAEDSFKNIDMTEFTEDFIESTTLTDVHDMKNYERRAFIDEDDTFAEESVKMERRTSPEVDKEMVRRAFQADQEKKIKRLLQEEDNMKKMQRRTFDVWGLLGFGEDKKYESIVKITKEVRVPVPYAIEKEIPVPVKVEVERPITVEVTKPYPVPVEKKIYYPVKEYIHALYPVYKKVPYLIKIAVEKPVPIPVSKPYPVYIEKKVPYPVEKQIPYPVQIPVDRPYPVHVPVLKNIYYPVERKVPYPVPVTVEKPVPVAVEKPYPVYIEKKVPVHVERHVPYQVPVDHKTEELQSHSVQTHEVETEYGGFVPLDHKYMENFGSQSFGQDELGEGDFAPSKPIVEEDDHTKLQKKKDEEEGLTLQESKREEKLEENKPTALQKQENKKIPDERGKLGKKDVQLIDKKMQKM